MDNAILIKWVPFFAAIGGALMGGLLTMLFQGYMEYIKYKNQRNSITQALLAEIEALLEIIERRRYVKAFEDIIIYLQKDANNSMVLSIDVQEEYARVYRKNIENIGKLEPNLVKKIVKFHILAESVVQDIKPDGLLSNPQFANLESFNETLSIFNEFIALGHEIIKQDIN